MLLLLFVELTCNARTTPFIHRFHRQCSGQFRLLGKCWRAETTKLWPVVSHFTETMEKRTQDALPSFVYSVRRDFRVSTKTRYALDPFLVSKKSEFKTAKSQHAHERGLFWVRPALHRQLRDFSSGLWDSPSNLNVFLYYYQYVLVCKKK